MTNTINANVNNDGLADALDCIRNPDAYLSEDELAEFSNDLAPQFA